MCKALGSIPSIIEKKGRREEEKNEKEGRKKGNETLVTFLTSFGLGCSVMECLLKCV
jgi:hypothetical protein